METYCIECGHWLIRIPRSAHKIVIMDYGWGLKMYLGTKFNRYTGKRQYGIIVQCPKARWWNNHTKTEDQSSLHDSDLKELINN